MANHAYVFNCKKRYSQEELDNLAEQFCKEVLKDLFKLVKGEESWRMLQFIDCDQIGVEFWIGWCLNEKCREVKAIEIRHGHSTDFEWWVDLYFTNWLAEKLQGNLMDDGDGKVNKPDVKKINSLDEYRKKLGIRDMFFVEVFKEFPKLKAFTNHPKCFVSRAQRLQIKANMAKIMKLMSKEKV